MSKGYIRYQELIGLVALVACLVPGDAMASDGRTINIPLPSKLTPVQRLNRDGVESIQKGNYKRAEELFYKAYLYDPSDPFTLNNLGYVAELEGQLERARKFYGLASEQSSNADIDKSSAKHLKGKPMRAALVGLRDMPMRVNRMNIDAMHLLSQGRSFEAIALLKHAQSLDSQNPFSANNLGFASEAVGDFEDALTYYHAAAAAHSVEVATITFDQSWRGRPVSEMAAASAERVEKRLRSMSQVEERAAMLTVRGVYSMNQNDWAAAKEDFLQAYSLDPNGAFTINNRGYVAEREGDLETAQYYYAKARNAEDSAAKVGLATDLKAEGKPLAAVAVESNDKVDAALDAYSAKQRQQTVPVELTPRGGSLPTSNAEPATPTTAQPATPQ
jgi:Flp pilus assembly protein TadD